MLHVRVDGTGEVVVKIATDAREMVPHLDAHLLEVLGIPDSRQQQELGGLECARG